MIDYPLQPVATVEAMTLEVRRVAGALVNDAIALLADPDRLGMEKTVHETRKRLKETRSLLRLLRNALVDGGGDRIRAVENEALKSAAARLGAARDAAVMLHAVRSLREDYGHTLVAGAFDDLLRTLGRRCKRMNRAGLEGMEPARQTLQEVRGHIDGWQLRAKSAWRAIAPNLHRIYDRGRSERVAAAARNDPHTWHEWRKRVKDLRYALELLRNAAPDLLGGMRDAARTLSDDIGLDHDLAVLLETVSRENLADAATYETLEILALRRRTDLQAKALPLGQRLYAEKSAAFIARVGRYWDTAIDMAPQVDSDGNGSRPRS